MCVRNMPVSYAKLEMPVNHLVKENSGNVVSWSHQQRKWWVVILFLLTATLYAARVAMPVCATAISKEYGWNKADLGAVMGSFFWGYLTTQVLGGYIADRIGGDKVLLFSVVVWGSLTMLTPLIAHFHSMYASTLVLLTSVRVLLGISQGVHYPSMMSLLSRKIPKAERSFPSGIITSAANFGTLACGGIGSLILEKHSWQDVFYLIGAMALFCAYALCSSVCKPKRHIVVLPYNAHSKVFDSKIDSVPWRKILTKSPVWCLIFAHVCINNCFYILLSWLPTYFHENFPNEKGYIYNTIPWIMSVPTGVLSGWISERLIQAKWSVGFTRKLMQAVAMLGSALFGIALPHCSTFSIAVLCAGMAVSLHSFHNSGILVNPQDIAPEYAGSVFGIMNAFGAIPGFVGVYFTGYILHVSKSWSVVFMIMGLINFLGISVFVFGGTGSKVV